MMKHVLSHSVIRFMQYIVQSTLSLFGMVLIATTVCTIFTFTVSNAQELTDLATIERFVAEGDAPTALAKLDQRIDANSNDVEARFLKGLVLMQYGNRDQARQVFEELVRLFPRFPEPFNNLATIYAAEGDYEKARQALLSASANAPDYATAHANLGDLYAKLAVDAYRQAVQLNPSDSAVKARLKALEQLFTAR